MNNLGVEESFARIHFRNSTQRVLVTGATGMIGQRLVRTLISNGHKVVILSRKPARAARLFDSKVQCIGNMHELPRNYGLDIIINLAGA
ncbi:SDR family NAD(P)-dependent oxidoreductase [Collimonas pratensis]|uniref:SDR family NAD(P)-dependent oxidoreductase n=1 Tax=Collimonas TaxID=202907 RepID=UPI0009EDD9B1|nr:SDR family NAD(P)-dependent oxidoreductase [Collimonas pratensis]